MNFGVKEVMVVAALAFGILAAGCSAPGTASLAMDPQVRVMNITACSDYRFCFSKYELDFYYPDGLPEKVEVAPNTEVYVPVIEPPAPGGPIAAGHDPLKGTPGWSLSLPLCFK